MNLCGAALVLLGCLYGAVSMTREQKRRVAALREMDAALERLRLSGLPDLTALLAGSSHGAAARFFTCLHGLLSELGNKPFHVLWETAVERSLQELSAEDRSELLRLGECLGRYELAEQLKALDACRAQLGRSIEARRSGLTDQRRLIFGLWLAAGGLLCIVLL